MVEQNPTTGSAGLSRREALRRAGVLAGSLAWATPAVQAFARPAAAQTQVLRAVQFEFVSGAWQEATTKTNAAAAPCDPAEWDQASFTSAADAGVTIELGSEMDQQTPSVAQSEQELVCDGFYSGSAECDGDCDRRDSTNCNPTGIDFNVAATECAGDPAAFHTIRLVVCCEA